MKLNNVDFTQFEDEFGNLIKEYEIISYDKLSNGEWVENRRFRSSRNHYIIDGKIYYRINNNLLPLNMDFGSTTCGVCYQLGNEIINDRRIIGNEVLFTEKCKIDGKIKGLSLHKQSYSNNTCFYSLKDENNKTCRLEYNSNNIDELIDAIKLDIQMSQDWNKKYPETIERGKIILNWYNSILNKLLKVKEDIKEDFYSNNEQQDNDTVKENNIEVVPDSTPGAATQETNLNMSLQLLAAEPTQAHFKRHGFRNWLKLIHEDNKNYSVEIQDTKDGYLLQIQIYEEKHEGYNKIINRVYKQYKEPNILNLLEDVKKTVESYLKEHLNICINIDISFIETYYIPFNKLTEIDRHLYKFKMLDSTYKTLEVEDLDTVEDYYKRGIDLKETLKEIYKHLSEIEDIFNRLYGHTNIIDLFKFIHDNNYKQNFRESFIKFIEEVQPCNN